MNAPATGAAGRERGIILDMFRLWDEAGTCATAFDHPALSLPDEVINSVCDGLVADGLIVPRWETQRDGKPILTPAGRRHLSTAEVADAGGVR